MMKLVRSWLFVVLGMLLIGCSSKSNTAANGTSALTVEEWKKLPPEQKYEIDTMERLKQGEPRLMEPREWEKFMRTTVLPGKQKEMPNHRPKM